MTDETKEERKQPSLADMQVYGHYCGILRELQRIVKTMSLDKDKDSVQWTPRLSGVQITFPKDQDLAKDGEPSPANIHFYRGGGAPLTLMHSLEESYIDAEDLLKVDSYALFCILKIAFILLRNHYRMLVAKIAKTIFDEEQAKAICEDLANKGERKTDDKQ